MPLELLFKQLIVREIPEVQVVERPPRPQRAAHLMAPPKTVLDGIWHRTGVQTVDIPALQVLEDEHREEVLHSCKGVSTSRNKVEGRRALRFEVALTQKNQHGLVYVATGANVEDCRQFHR